MKRILVIILLVLCSLGVSVFAVEGQEQNIVCPSSEMSVYVCTGSYATKYHSKRNCSGLGNCKGSIVSMPVSRARQQGRTACKRCC